MASAFQVGERVRLKVDALGHRAGDCGRVSRVDRRQVGGGEVVLYVCEMDAGGGTRLAAFYPDEIEAGAWASPAAPGRPRRPERCY